MDFTQTQSIIGWIIGSLGIGMVSLITGGIAIYKSSRMMPKELTGADLDNKSKEVSVAVQYEEAAEKAVAKSIKIQEQYNELQTQYKTYQEESMQRYEDLIKQFELQQQCSQERQEYFDKKLKEQEEKYDLLLKEQEEKYDKIILAQSDRIDSQDEEIAKLAEELDNYVLYSNALIEQMKEAHITPIKIETIRKKRKKNGE